MKGRSVPLLSALVLLAVLVIAAIWTLVAPLNQAEGVVHLEYGGGLREMSGGKEAIPFYEGFVSTQISVMQSQSLLGRVLEERDIQETRWYKRPRRSILQRLRGRTPSHMERLKDALSVQLRPPTGLIHVSFSDPSAEDAILILNTILDEYVEYVGEPPEDAIYSQLEYAQQRSLESAIKRRESVVAGLRESPATMEQQQRESQESSAKAQLLEEKEAELQRMRDLYNSLPRTRKTIISRASVPSESRRDRRLLYTCVALGLALPIGSAIVLLERKRRP